MLQIRNDTAFVPGMFVFPDERGVDTVYVVLKATFDISSEEPRVAARQRGLTLADEYWGEPGASSLRYAGEAHLLKPGTDVVLMGEAHAPGGRPVTSCAASVTIGSLAREIAVFGDRRWTRGVVAPGISPPEPFSSMPLIYERAYGGEHLVDRTKPALAEARNPVGRGFQGKRGVAEMIHVALPNLEDPRALIRDVADRPAPVGTGFIAPSWAPRRDFAGTYDQQWQQERAPYLPRDFRPDFFRVASAGLSARGFLGGGEPVELINVARRGPLRFKLPCCELEVGLRIRGRAHRVAMFMETVLLEPDASTLVLTWRGGRPCDKQVLQVEQVTFQVAALTGVAGDA